MILLVCYDPFLGFTLSDHQMLRKLCLNYTKRNQVSVYSDKNYGRIHKPIKESCQVTPVNLLDLHLSSINFCLFSQPPYLYVQLLAMSPSATHVLFQTTLTSSIILDDLVLHWTHDMRGQITLIYFLASYSLCPRTNVTYFLLFMANSTHVH